MNGLNNRMENFTGKQFINSHDMNKGKVVRRYNISTAELEYYFIPFENIDSYDSAKIKQEQNAGIIFGKRLKVMIE